MNDLDDFYKDEQNHHELYLHDDGSMTTMAASSPVTTNSISSSTNTNTDTNTRDSSTAPYANHGAPPFHNPNTAPSSDQQGNPITNFFSKSGHPITCVFHILFKVTAILIYLMGGVFEKSTNFVSVTVLCVICLSMDFWCVKNITGRLLVGLRWWANEEVVPLVTTAQRQRQQQYPITSSTTKWIFESKQNYKPNAFDQWWFWTVLYANCVIWIVFFFSSLLKWNFGWLLVDGFGILLAFANVYGYWQCSKEQKTKFDNALKMQLEKGVTAGANYSMKSGIVGSWMSSVLSSDTTSGMVAQPSNTHSFV